MLEGINVNLNSFSLPSGVDGIAATNINLWETDSCQQCWNITGSGGSAVIWITDKCGGVQNATSCYQQALTGTPQTGCDWCFTTDHRQFDVDKAVFQKVCGSLDLGWCFLTAAEKTVCDSHINGLDGEA